MEHENNILVIGGGAAGMIAAWRAASLGASVLLLEKNPKLGIKILISGGGKCNITNGSDIQAMLKRFQTQESRFLKYAFHKFTNTDLLELLHMEGVETYTRENGKVFPRSHDAEDVVKAFRSLMERSHVEIRLQSPVQGIIANADGTFNVKTSRDLINASKVIVATGGSSYQKTGTTGDGFRWMEKLGHTIVPLRPALTPIFLTPAPPSSWQGTPIRDCTLTAFSDDAVVSEAAGDVLITHFGISGPATLETSRAAYLEFEQHRQLEMCIDFYPELSFDQLDGRLIADISMTPSRSILTLTEQLIPQKLAEYLLIIANIASTKKLNQLSKDERRQMAKRLKRFPLGMVKDIPLDQGEVTAGGVALNEVAPTTMESKLVQGMYLCGEILDIAGPVGGYNLQAAFSTGYVAGEHAAKERSMDKE